MKYIALFLIISLALAGCSRDGNSKEVDEKLHAQLNDDLDTELGNAYALDLLKGFSVAVVDEDSILFAKGYGYKNIDTTKLYTSSTVQPVGSISKTFIGVSLIKAVELELLDFDDPINDYLPFKVANPNHPEREILIEHLAYHTSSIVDSKEIYLSTYFLESSETGSNEGAYDFFRKPEERETLEEYLTNVLDPASGAYSSKLFSTNEPGMVREYSNLASDLCALVILMPRVAQ